MLVRSDEDAGTEFDMRQLLIAVWVHNCASWLSALTLRISKLTATDIVVLLIDDEISEELSLLHAPLALGFASSTVHEHGGGGSRSAGSNDGDALGPHLCGIDGLVGVVVVSAEDGLGVALVCGDARRRKRQQDGKPAHSSESVEVESEKAESQTSLQPFTCGKGSRRVGVVKRSSSKLRHVDGTPRDDVIGLSPDPAAIRNRCRSRITKWSYCKKAPLRTSTSPPKVSSNELHPACFRRSINRIDPNERTMSGFSISLGKTPSNMELLLAKAKGGPAKSAKPKLAFDDEDDEDDAPDTLGGPSSSGGGLKSKAKGKGKPNLHEPPERKPAAEKPVLLSRAERKAQEAALALDASVFDYDGVYDTMKAAERKVEAAKAASEDKTKPKYIESFLAAAQTRKLDRLRAEEKMLQREREKEGDEFEDKEKFVTEAYKKQMEEVRQAEEEERVREGECVPQLCDP